MKRAHLSPCMVFMECLCTQRKRLWQCTSFITGEAAYRGPRAGRYLIESAFLWIIKVHSSISVHWYSNGVYCSAQSSTCNWHPAQINLKSLCKWSYKMGQSVAMWFRHVVSAIKETRHVQSRVLLPYSLPWFTNGNWIAYSNCFVL